MPPHPMLLRAALAGTAAAALLGIAASRASADIAITNVGSDTVNVYSGDLAGGLSPSRSIAGSHTGLNRPAQDGLSANGDSRPIAVIAGPGTQLNSPRAIAMTASGDLLVANLTSNSVADYVPGNGTPVHVISGPATGLSFPDGVDVDSQGRIYVSNQFGDSVTIYAPQSDGNVAPLGTITGSQTGISAPTGLAVTPPLAILTARLRAAKAGHRYRAQLRAADATTPYRWSVVKGRLPRGLVLRSDGVIAGRAQRPGRARFTVRLTDSSRPRVKLRAKLVLVVKRR